MRICCCLLSSHHHSCSSNLKPQACCLTLQAERQDASSDAQVTPDGANGSEAAPQNIYALMLAHLRRGAYHSPAVSQQAGVYCIHTTFATLQQESRIGQ
jgi:hypothetical protein